MYAVIRTGGKQFTVSEGDLLKVEKLPGEIGSKVEIADILAVGSGDDLNVGQPAVDKASVIAEIVEQGKSKKIIVFKKKKRKGYTKKQGHRQQFTNIRIKEIKV
ncbi:MAG: 50S ribosomal protein L21 [Thermodesulfobacteriota bacterium]